MNKKLKNASDILFIIPIINIIGLIGFLFIEGDIVPAVIVIWFIISYFNEQKAKESYSDLRKRKNIILLLKPHDHGAFLVSKIQYANYL